MTQRLTRSLLAASILLALSDLDLSAKRTATPVRRIDHIMIRADDPARIIGFFTEVLRLPVAWPVMSPREGVTTGGVGFGNVNVEAIRFPGQKSQAGKVELLGFAFEPSPLVESLAELDRRGIRHGDPRPLVSTGPDGSSRTLWTNVTLPQFSDGEAADATMHVFLSEYSPTYTNVEERRERLRRQLAESSGGPLGVEAVKEVVIGVADMKVALGLWQKLLDPTPVSGPSMWQVSDGPAIRLVHAKQNQAQELVITVASLARAKAFLRTRGLLGTHSDREATIDPSKIHGLNISVEEKQR